MMAKINIDKMAFEVMRNLKIFHANTAETVDKAVLETAKETVNELEKTSPKGATGDYAESWAQKKDPKEKGMYRFTRIVYSKKPQYRKTHVLERGHAKVNGGRVDPYPHIKKAEENAIIRVYTRLLRNLLYEE